jgi:hypothetical protein
VVQIRELKFRKSVEPPPPPPLPPPPPDNRRDNADADAEGVEAMPTDGRAFHPLPAVQMGRGCCGAANLAPAGPAPAASPKPAGRGKGKRT